MGVSIIARMRLRGATRARRQADSVLKVLDQIEHITKDTLPKMKDRFNENLRTGLDILSTMQLLRFSIRDVQQLATGRGGLGDILSLGTSAILLMYRLRTLMGAEAMASIMGSLAGIKAGLIGALGPLGLGVIGGVALGGGMLMAMRGIESYYRELRRGLPRRPWAPEQVPYGGYYQSPQFQRGARLGVEPLRRTIARRDIERVVGEVE